MIQSKQCFKKTSLRDKLEYIHEGVGLEIYQMFTRWVVGLQVCFVLSFPRIFLVIFWTVDSLTVSVPKIKKKKKLFFWNNVSLVSFLRYLHVHNVSTFLHSQLGLPLSCFLSTYQRLNVCSPGCHFPISPTVTLWTHHPAGTAIPSPQTKAGMKTKFLM